VGGTDRDCRCWLAFEANKGHHCKLDGASMNEPQSADQILQDVFAYLQTEWRAARGSQAPAASPGDIACPSTKQMAALSCDRLSWKLGQLKGGCASCCSGVNASAG